MTTLPSNEKLTNRSRVFRYMMSKPNSTKKAMLQALNISMPTLMRNLSELNDMKLIRVTGQDVSGGGRRPEFFSVDERAKVAIGLDVTRNHIAVIAVDLGVNVLQHRREYLPFENSPAYFQKIGAFVENFIASLGVRDEDILGVGLSVPGILSQDRSRLLYGDVINFNGGSITRFADVLRFPCRPSNDSTAAGIAEFTDRPELENAVYLYLSNSVGGSIMLGGSVYEGGHSKSAEFGHMCIEPGGRECYCGLHGCLNAYCNATLLADAAGGNVEDFFEKLRTGDGNCRSVWEQYKCHLARAIRMLRTVFDADIILGGYVGSCMGEYIGEIREELMRDQLFESGADYILPCRYTVEAAALGAALYYIRSYIDTV